MRSQKLEQALEGFIEQAGAYLRQELADGAEVPFELAATPGRGQRTPLYSYRPLTASFICERASALRALPGYAPAAELASGAAGLERYLLAKGVARPPVTPGKSAETALLALLTDVFTEQTDFEVRPERARAALDSLQQSASVRAEEVTVLAGLRGLALASTELMLTRGLMLAQPGTLDGLPDALAQAAEGEHHLVALFTSDEPDPRAAVAHGREVLNDLLRALRLFGDGRISLDGLAWVRVGSGSWSPVATSSRGRPHGMLLVTGDQEDELRAFCNLVSRRAPADSPLAWALERFQIGSEQQSEYRALSDYLLALRALLEPEGHHSGLLAGRLAALCATPERRGELVEQVSRALALERGVIAGTAKQSASAENLVRAIAGNLRALLRDVICGHLDPQLTLLADELLDAEAQPERPSGEEPARRDAASEEGQEPAARQGELWPEDAAALII